MTPKRHWIWPKWITKQLRDYSIIQAAYADTNYWNQPQPYTWAQPLENF